MHLYSSILVIIWSAQLHNVFGKCRPSTYSINSYHLSGHMMSTRIVSGLSECVRMCAIDVHCKSVNFFLINKSCDLNEADRHSHPKGYRPFVGCVYMEMSTPFKKVCYFSFFPVLKCETKRF